MYQPTYVLGRKQMAVLLALLIAVMPFSIDAYLPALPQIAAALQTDIHYVEKSLGSFILGAAIGQLLGGSLSDIKGRRNIALVGLVIYVAATAVLVLVQSYEQLMLLRVVQAVGSGMAVVTVGAIVRDNYHGRDAAEMFALIGIIMMAAPLVAPLVGALLQSVGGWRSIFAFLLVYGLLVGVLLYRFLPQHKVAEPITRTEIGRIGRRYVQVLRHKVALGFLFYQALSFSAMLVFLTESPFVYMQLYGLTPHEYAWLFCGNIVMMMVCNRLTALGLRRQWAPRDLLKIGVLVQVLANVVLVAMVLWFGRPLLWCLAPVIMLSLGMQGLIVANTQAMFMSHFRAEIGGSANAMLAAMQSFIGAAIGFLTTILHNGTVMVMVVMMLACTSVGAALLYGCSRGQLFGAEK